MSNMCRCTMCGLMKPVDMFRPYPSGTRRRTYCKDCEYIEVRRRYIQKLADEGKLAPESPMYKELDDINELYEQRLAAGLNTFGQRRKRKKSSEYVTQQLDALLGNSINVEDIPD